MIKGYYSTEGNYLKELEIKKSNSNVIDIKIDGNMHYQTILGFGGALTDAASFNYELLSEDKKSEFIRKVFTNEGLNYNFIRLSIGSCDFAKETYDYLDEEGNFSLEHDLKSIIPLVKRIKNLTDINVFASPWSPPAKYKTNNCRQHGGKLKDDCYDLYSHYLLTYLKNMKENGINIDYMTLQNEPQAVQIWDSCIYEGPEEARLLEKVYHLIKQEGLDTKILIWDHNKDVIVDRIKETITKENSSYIYGIAYHWYDNYCNQELSKVHQLYKDKVLMFTEGCVELLLMDKDNPEKNIGNFANGLRYAKNYILDLENYSSCFIDWNLLLDEKGGPNYVGNYCEAPIMYNKEEDKLVYNPSYYIISHFSSFISKGDVRVKTIVYDESILATSCKKLDNNTYIIIVFNQENDKNIKIEINDEIFEIFLKEGTVATLIYKQ